MKKLLSLIVIIFTSVPAVLPQEFLLHEETFTWTKDADNCGGFHYWKDYGEAGTMNWQTPNDYEHGQFYFRFEILDQPTSAPCQFNFCIWSELAYPFWKEECAGLSPKLYGPGSVVTFNSPMNFKMNGGIDWSDLTKLWRFGDPIWVNGHNLGPSIYCSDNPEEWEHVADYFPMTLRITIVAVALGNSFSGWENYTGYEPPVKKPTPNYSADFANEQTNKIVPSTDEYSTNSNMSGALTGNGQKLSLTPGTDIYFRTKAAGGLLASDVQHLDIPGRPASPNITINYTNEATSAVSSALEYSLNSSMNPVTVGGNGSVPVTPGTDLFFRQRATATAFASNVQAMDVPLRPNAPAITINYPVEVTSDISSGIEYSVNLSMSPVTFGTNAGVTLTPGTDLYFRQRATSGAFASTIQTLNVPERPTIPSITIDYAGESTSPISSGHEYSTYSDMSSALSGSNSVIPVTPGTKLYMRVKSTSSSFASAVQILDVPERPSTPVFAIDFASEKTLQDFSPDLAYSFSPDLTGPVDGTGAKISLAPGQDLYIWKKATSLAFASDEYHLVVPLRPDPPVYSINYLNESTLEEILSGHEYSDSSDMTGAVPGIGSSLALHPGTDYYFRLMGTLSSFVGDVFQLVVPERPVIISQVGDTTLDDFFLATVDFSADATGFDTSGIETLNATVILTEPQTLKIDPVSTGEVNVRIKANAILAGNYASEILKTYYREIATSLPDPKVIRGSLLVFPSPFRDFLNIRATGSLVLPLEISLLNSNGLAIVLKKLVSSSTILNLNHLQRGIYILRAIDSTGTLITCKVIKL